MEQKQVLRSVEKELKRPRTWYYGIFTIVETEKVRHTYAKQFIQNFETNVFVNFFVEVNTKN